MRILAQLVGVLLLVLLFIGWIVGIADRYTSLRWAPIGDLYRSRPQRHG